MNRTRQTNFWLKVIAVLWIVWIFIDYWFKHPLYARAVGNTFAGIPVIHLVLGAVAFYLFQHVLKGISVAALIVLFMSFLWGGTLVNLFMYSSVDYQMSNVLLYLLRSFGFVMLVLMVLWSSILVGRMMLNILLPERDSLLSVLSLATGLCIFILILFLLLALGVFYGWTIALLLALPFLLNLKHIVPDVRSMLKPIPSLSKIGHLGILCLLLIVLMNAITYGHTLSPFPVGFDALNYYINLPKLIAQGGELMKGYQPYNWSILQAAGVALSGRIELALIFSWMGLILVQWSAYEIGDKLMKLPVELTLVGVLLFTYMPSVTTQASQELKVDLGLTYMLLAMVLAGFHLMKSMDGGHRRPTVIWAIIIGMLGGIALGIKLTAVIAIFAIVGLIWYKSLGRRAFIGVFLICLALVFLAQLDTKAGLRSYHASVQWLQFVVLLAGLALVGISAWKERKKALYNIIISGVIALAATFCFSPWMIKNYSEIESPSFIQLINGSSHGPTINMKLIDRNLKKQKR